MKALIKTRHGLLQADYVLQCNIQFNPEQVMHDKFVTGFKVSSKQ